MSTTNYGSISQRTAAWAAKEMIEHAMPIEVLAKFAQSKPIPKNTADNAKFRRPIPFPPALTPLTEGVTPAGRAMQYEDVSVTLNQYGDYVEITDKVMDMSEDPVLKDASALIGEQAAETMENILWGVLRGGTSVAYTNGSARNTVNTAMTGATGLTLIRNAVRSLKAQRAKFLTEMMSSTVNYKTEPVDNAFIAFGHTDLEKDIRGITGFVSSELYGGATKRLPFEIGKVENVRFILSPVLTPFYGAGSGTLNGMTSQGGANVDVYPLVIVAKDSYANVALRGANAMTPMVLNPGVPRGGDPLGQRGTVGWKSYYAALRLNEAWMTRIECGATA